MSFRIEFSRLYPWQDIRVSTFYSDLRRNTSRDGSSHLLRPQGISKQCTHCNSLIQDWSQCTKMSKYLLNTYYFFTSVVSWSYYNGSKLWGWSWWTCDVFEFARLVGGAAEIQNQLGFNYKLTCITVSPGDSSSLQTLDSQSVRNIWKYELLWQNGMANNINWWKTKCFQRVKFLIRHTFNDSFNAWIRMTSY